MNNMADLREIFRSFNAKERYYLIKRLLGISDFIIDENLIQELDNAFGLKITSGSAYVAMDYHLDWAFAGIKMYINNIKPGIPFSTKGDSGEKVIYGQIEDADLFICHYDGLVYHLIFIEAKGVMGWTKTQITSKAKRLTAIFGENGDVYPGIVPHFAYFSDFDMPYEIAAELPAWAKTGDGAVRINLGLPNGLLRVVRIKSSFSKGDYTLCKIKAVPTKQIITKGRQSKGVISPGSPKHFEKLGKAYFDKLLNSAALKSGYSVDYLLTGIEYVGLGKKCKEYKEFTGIDNWRGPNWYIKLKNGEFISKQNIRPDQVSSTNYNFFKWEEIQKLFYFS